MAAELVEFSSRPTPRFHGAVPKLLEEVKKLSAAGERVMLGRRLDGRTGAAGRHLQRVSGAVPAGHARQGGQRQRGGHLLQRRERGDHAGTGIRPDGVVLPDAKLVLFGANDLFDDSEAGATRQPRQRSKTSAFLSDFRDLAVGDYVVHVEHGIGQLPGLARDSAGGRLARPSSWFWNTPRARGCMFR